MNVQRMWELNVDCLMMIEICRFINFIGIFICYRFRLTQLFSENVVHIFGYSTKYCIKFYIQLLWLLNTEHK